MLPAVAIGLFVTTALIVVVTGAQPGVVTVKVYVQLAAEVAEGMVAFCNALVNPFGPVQP